MASNDPQRAACYRVTDGEAQRLHCVNAEALALRSTDHYAQHPIERILAECRSSCAIAFGDNAPVLPCAGSDDALRLASAEAVARSSLRGLRPPPRIPRSRLEYFEVAPVVAQAEANALRLWARHEGLIVDARSFEHRWKEAGMRGGAEHQVYYDESDGRWWKRTKRPLSGPLWSSYLQRTRLHAALFPYSAPRLEGLHSDSDGALWIVTSQADVAAGTSPLRLEALRSLMESGGFQWVPEEEDSGDQFRFYNAVLGIWIRDLHAANAYYTPDGCIAAIDPVIEVCRLGDKSAFIAASEGLPVPIDDK